MVLALYHEVMTQLMDMVFRNELGWICKMLFEFIIGHRRLYEYLEDLIRVAYDMSMLKFHIGWLGPCASAYIIRVIPSPQGAFKGLEVLNAEF